MSAPGDSKGATEKGKKKNKKSFELPSAGGQEKGRKKDLSAHTIEREGSTPLTSKLSYHERKPTSEGKGGT